MKHYYNEWVEKEQAWIEEIDRKTKAAILKYGALTIAGCVVVLGAIGLLAGGTPSISGMLHNMLIGLGFGVFVMLLTLCLTVKKPSKRYMKSLQEITGALSPGEREELATQMLSPDVIRVDYKAVDKTEERILLSQDFLISSSGKGEFVLIRLRSVDRIETDLRDTSYIVRTNGTRLTVNDAVFVICFYYRSISDGGKQKMADAVCVFPDRTTRDRVVEYIVRRDQERSGLYDE